MSNVGKEDLGLMKAGCLAQTLVFKHNMFEHRWSFDDFSPLSILKHDKTGKH